MPVSSPTAPATHALWRVSGEHAKGILYESGRVHTWPEAEASHGAIARDHVARTGDRRYAQHAATLVAALREADPGLTVVAPAGSAGCREAGAEKAAVAALCRWLEFGTPVASSPTP